MRAPARDRKWIILVLATGLAAGCDDRSSSDVQPLAAGVPRGLAIAKPGGRWAKARIDASDPGLTTEQRAQIERLQSIGYVTGSRIAEAGQTGVTIHDPERTWVGRNLYVSGHGPEATLMDMTGRVLHRWRYAFSDLWPDSEFANRDTTLYYRRVFPFPNGEIIVIFEGFGLVKLDRDSNVVWAHSNRAHHDLEIAANGDLYVLTRQAHIVPAFDPQHPVLEDFVSVLDGSGVERWSLSLLEAFMDGEFEWVWHEAAAQVEHRQNVFHTNSVRLLPPGLEERHPAFREGHLLVSFRAPDLIAVIDPVRRRATWVGRGTFRKQHDAKTLHNGNLFVFDNRGAGSVSRVLELRLPSLEIAWQYSGTDESPFYTHALGAAHRLPNGNTLIIESDNGRAIEVTAEGEIVWEFRSPHRAGPDQQFVASLADLVRLPPGFGSPWLGP